MKLMNKLFLLLSFLVSISTHLSYGLPQVSKSALNPLRQQLYKPVHQYSIPKTYQQPSGLYRTFSSTPLHPTELYKKHAQLTQIKPQSKSKETLDLVMLLALV